MHDAGSVDAERIVSSARSQARRLGHRRIGTEHLLLGLLVDEHSGTADLLHAAGCTLGSTQQMVVEFVPVPDAGGDDGEPGEFTPRAERAIGRAGRFARQERAAEVDARHLLLGVLDVEGLACQVLRRLDVDLAGLRRAAQAPEVAAPAGPDVTQEVALDVGPVTIGPRCPGCGAALAGSLAVSALDADDGSPTGRQVDVAHCTECGVAIGTVA